MTREEGSLVGWEWFDQVPLAARGADDACDSCGEVIRAGYLEMECDCWLCPDCFAKLPFEPCEET
jgi:formylmethanofuran dehydrogenase subunit E